MRQAHVVAALFLSAAPLSLPAPVRQGGRLDEASSAVVDPGVRAQAARKAGADPERFAFAGDRVERPERMLLFLHLRTAPTPALLESLRALGADLGDEPAYVPPVGRHPRGYLIADAPVSAIDSIARLPEVALIRSGERRLEPLFLNDLAGGAGPLGVEADALHALGFDGTGVTVAILDSSLDVSHPDFPTPVAAKDYSAFPAIDDDVASLVTGHGTHVTGSVLGRGTASGGLYAGQAPGADLVFLKIGNDSTSSASSAAMAGAIRAAVDLYDADIVSASYGGFGLYQDGSEEIEQAADYAFSQGALVLFSAGNSAQSGIHVSGTVAGGETSPFIQVNVGTTAGTTLYFTLVWADGIGSTDDLDLRFYDGSQTEITSDIVVVEHPESPRGTECDETWYGVSVPGPATYHVRVQNHSSNSRFFHAFSFGSRVTFASPDSDYTVVLPSIADEAISVAAYCSRQTYVDWCGTTRGFGQTLGNVATFSSRGPRIGDDAEKPSLAAPGTAVISALDSDRPYGSSLRVADDGVSDCTGPTHYNALQGTSMACPTAAGSAALLIHAYPALRGRPAIFRDLLERSSDNAGSWDKNDGYGFMDVFDAYSSAVIAVALDGGEFPVTQPVPAAFDAHAAVTVEGVCVDSGLVPGDFSVTIGGSAATVLGATFDGGALAWTLTIDPPSLPEGSHDVVVDVVVALRTSPPDAVAGGYVVPESVSVDSIVPGKGPTPGGTAVTIGGAAAGSIVVVDSGTITATTPAGALGFADVAVSNENGAGSLASGFEYFEPVFVGSIDPSCGPVAGGTPVTVTGAGFVAGTTLSIGGTSVTPVVVDASTLTATAPAGLSGPADVTVSNGNGSDSLAGGFEYIGPEVTALYGAVNAGAGPVADVLLVNGGIGDPKTRVVRLGVGEAFLLTTIAAPSAVTSKFALYVWTGPPDAGTPREQPFGIGTTAFPTPLQSADSPQAAAIFNNIGKFSKLGTPDYPSRPAPSTVVNKASGFGRPLVVTIQGLMVDVASAGAKKGSATNGVVVMIE